MHSGILRPGSKHFLCTVPSLHCNIAHKANAKATAKAKVHATVKDNAKDNDISTKWGKVHTPCSTMTKVANNAARGWAMGHIGGHDKNG